MRKAVLVLLAAAALVRPAGAQLSLRFFGQLARVDGGDLNAMIRGRQDWCRDRDRAPASFDCTLEPLRRFAGGGLGLEFDLTSRLSVGIGVELLEKTGRGEIRTAFRETETGVLPNGDVRAATLTESVASDPEYTLRAVPVVAYAALALPLASRLEVIATAGAGLHFGTLTHNDDYQVLTGAEEVLTGGGMSRTFTSDYFVEGRYREETTARAFGAFAGLGVEYALGGAISLTAEITGRRAVFDDWRGTSRDQFDWDLVSGESGAIVQESGREEIDTDGRLWFVESADPRASVPYLRLVLSGETPAEASAFQVRRARISLDGLSLRIGFRVAL